jgi:uncharacterized tellurite resistance protein B-like protein
MDKKDDIIIDDLPDFTPSQEELDRMAKGAAEDTEERFLTDLGKQHEKEMKALNSDEAIVAAFPLEQALVVQKLEEYFEEAADLYSQMVQIRNIMDNVQADPFSKWFFINAAKYKEGEKLKTVYENIKRLRRLKIVYEKKRIESLLKFTKFDTKEEKKKYNTDTMMGREGLLFDVLEYDNIKLKGKGSRSMGLCPFHSEKTPSFAAYSDNWYHCFGCQAHGNVFDYVMKTRNLGFKQALEEVDRFL